MLNLSNKWLIILITCFVIVFRAKSLEELQLKKEWQLAYKMFPQTNTDKSTKENPPPDATDAKETEINKEQAPGGSNLITVYTAFTQAEKRSQ